MKRVILKVPEGLTFEALTDSQQAAINSVFAQYVLPMPLTQTQAGYMLIDAIVEDSFNPATMGSIGLPFEVLGLWQWDGKSKESATLQELDSTFINYLPDICTYDFDTHALLTTTPATLYEPHRWAGWPEITL